MGQVYAGHCAASNPRIDPTLASASAKVGTLPGGVLEVVPVTKNVHACDTDLVTGRRLWAAAATSMIAVGLVGCAGPNSPNTTPTTTSSPATTPTQSASTPSTPVIAPVTMDIDEVQGATVELVVGQVLNINTGDLAVDSYSGEVDDPAIAEFVPGRVDGSATFNPGITALAPGSTGVVLSNTDGGIEDVTFSVSVTEG